MKKTRKFFAILLSAALLLTMLPQAAFAKTGEGKAGGNITITASVGDDKPENAIVYGAAYAQDEITTLFEVAKANGTPEFSHTISASQAENAYIELKFPPTSNKTWPGRVFEGFDVNGTFIPLQGAQDFDKIDGFTMKPGGVVKTQEIFSGEKRIFLEGTSTKNLTVKAIIKPEAAATHTLTTISADAAMGDVEKKHINGDVWRLTAAPKDGYGFTGWNDGSKAPIRTVKLTENTTYTASFAKIAVDITGGEYGATGTCAKEGTLDDITSKSEGNLYRGMNGGALIHYTATGDIKNKKLNIKVYDSKGDLAGSYTSNNDPDITAGKAVHQMVRFNGGLKKLDQDHAKVVLTFGEGSSAIQISFSICMALLPSPKVRTTVA